ncbi:MAG: hypothetical protein ACRDXF_09255 [Acidimicrobiia bacterium]
MPDQRRTLALVKGIHTVIWALVEAAMVYLLVSGASGRSDRRAGTAAAIVGAESLVFLANGARCPLTGLAESLGAQDGSVTDLYLPGWLARSLPLLHVPLVVAAGWLHWRNLRGGELLRRGREISPASERAADQDADLV